MLDSGATDELVYPCSIGASGISKTRTNKFVRATRSPCYYCDHPKMMGRLRRTSVLGAPDKLVYPCSIGASGVPKTRTNEFVRATLLTK